tara:strand:+ start:242 stop:442 length:201 start_codon:yes stop_codon:yes gene_type:complete
MSQNNPGLPTITDCQTDALILHGLVQALEEIDGSTTPQAFQGRGALLVAIERMASKLAINLEKVTP